MSLTDRIVGVWAPDVPGARDAIDAILDEARSEGEARLARQLALIVTITVLACAAIISLI